jgi:signal transduction histidine kinase
MELVRPVTIRGVPGTLLARVRALPPYRFDALLALAVYVEVCAELVVLAELRGAKLALGLVLAGLFGLGMALRRRVPLAAIALATGGVAAGGLLGSQVTDNVTSPLFVAMFVNYTAGTVLEGRRLAAGFGVGAILVAVSVLTDPENPGPIDLVFSNIFAVAGPMLCGVLLRNRARLNQALRDKAQRAEQDRAEEAEAAALEERTRIASELHDVVAHALSAMTVQATAARRLADRDPGKAAAAFSAVEGTGREALTELRRLLGVLRKEDEELALAPQPSLAHVRSLIQRAGAAGLYVELRIEGEPVLLPAGVDLTAYRLVQEGLTNSIKHAAASRADVRVRYDGDHVEIEICDDGRGADGADAAANGGGHGLVGMRERVSIYGGELEAGPRAEGGFRLRARLPVTT